MTVFLRLRMAPLPLGMAMQSKKIKREKLSLCADWLGTRPIALDLS
jgi:hypothetical protein